MADNIRFVPSAFWHGCSQDDIEWAIETKIYDGLLRGEKVFHAMPLRDKVAAQMDEEN